jgi:hypothetical protein
MAATFNKFNAWVDFVQKGVNLSSDTLKVLLCNTLPTTGNSLYGHIASEVSAGNGYATSGTAVQIYSNAQAGGVYTLSCSSVVFTAAGGNWSPFQYVVLWDSTPSGGPLTVWFDYGSPITLNNGETFTVSFNSTNPGTVYTLT